ncbi:flagellar hook-length control protein FliK [Petrotoga sp. 9PWA.NaAc.5.4]|uniref:flagellar hook-length control protein FliK n=1 Tax=Petrotoga sp. 9PWA.NaAc.5.4 TaxID=1434328 RepID=UPI000CB3564A|nr:flagellar hook-length control protein FliK [Petrotoga sp. 9PWA.NaAc.5.4]PNR92572.1 hypothetical protein X924_09595 [Petrotoga sp. 9PWA.NaAc.5.4]
MSLNNLLISSDQIKTPLLQKSNITNIDSAPTGNDISKPTFNSFEKSLLSAYNSKKNIKDSITLYDKNEKLIIEEIELFDITSIFKGFKNLKVDLKESKEGIYILNTNEDKEIKFSISFEKFLNLINKSLNDKNIETNESLLLKKAELILKENKDNLSHQEKDILSKALTILIDESFKTLIDNFNEGKQVPEDFIDFFENIGVDIKIIDLKTKDQSKIKLLVLEKENKRVIIPQNTRSDISDKGILVKLEQQDINQKNLEDMFKKQDQPNYLPKETAIFEKGLLQEKDFNVLSNLNSKKEVAFNSQTEKVSNQKIVDNYLLFSKESFKNFINSSETENNFLMYFLNDQGKEKYTKNNYNEEKNPKSIINQVSLLSQDMSNKSKVDSINQTNEESSQNTNNLLEEKRSFYLNSYDIRKNAYIEKERFEKFTYNLEQKLEKVNDAKNINFNNSINFEKNSASIQDVNFNRNMNLKNTVQTNLPTINLNELNSQIKDIVVTKNTQTFINESFSVKVSPPNLGKVDFQIIKSGESITINIVTENENSKSIISKTIQSLVGNLRDEGYQPVNIKINVEQEQNYLNTPNQHKQEQQNQEKKEHDENQEEDNLKYEFVEYLRGDLNA